MATAVDVKPRMNAMNDITSSGATNGVALENLFDDEPSKPKIPSSTATLETMSDLSNPYVMLTYYRRVLPFKQMFLWLNQAHVPTKQFTHREFALTLSNDVYLRYQSYANADEMKKEIVRLNPARFEIGPTYSGRPKDRRTLMKHAFRPTSRELVFDIDMTDYDNVRTCCKDKAMCKRCWRFIAMAVKVLDKTLRTDFGFQHLLWVYSGRRGIHCWISDAAAVNMNDEQRRAIVNYLEVIKGKKLELRRPLHPSMQRSLDLLKPYFARVVLQDQNCFAQPEQWEAALATLPDKDYATKLSQRFPAESENVSAKTSTERWGALRIAPPSKTHIAEAKYLDAVEDLILQYTYPRIDTEVSKKLNHLLKAPFCVHPETGRVCVPLLAEQVEAFEPEAVPTVGQLLMELEHVTVAGDDSASWDKTSLRPYVELFERHIDGIIKAKNKTRKEEQGVSMEF
ncbi:DNA primase small subunit [Microbotryum lychnidis-dioicae p1A1 Lamole]|uniref:DNA primase n=1 Tax=Microbotryum lychnidis-dioicae (strain p1A1 Lamole / MvSl-1064) TaxID=683840 RepID=U5H1X0_USTV1|nr:DNA primase small subunit [Microbotryum lychnidis-dioicae p1A1 Lamole]|eukprot:KDE08325.1 DNA primase small subunit [Microbotryum lychnidis-dioicae p1A1 Lamole]